MSRGFYGQTFISIIRVRNCDLKASERCISIHRGTISRAQGKRRVKGKLLKKEGEGKALC